MIKLARKVEVWLCQEEGETFEFIEPIERPVKCPNNPKHHMIFLEAYEEEE